MNETPWNDSAINTVAIYYNNSDSSSNYFLTHCAFCTASEISERTIRRIIGKYQIIRRIFEATRVRYQRTARYNMVV